VNTREEDRLANVLGALALAVTDEVAAATEQAVGHTGAGPAALVALQEFLDGGSVDRLRRAVGLTHSGAVRAVDRLEGGGLVERRPGADGRSVSVVVTPEGRRVAQQAADARRATVRALLGVLDAGERVVLTSIVEKLVAAAVTGRLAARAAGREPPGGWFCRLCDPGACQRPEGRCPAANAAGGTPAASR
jgi:DNA-binding MarR family transcriptional regulator